MATKLTRVFQKVFGLTGDQSHFGQFGSKAAGSPLLTKDPVAIQAQSAFDGNGWLDAINASNKAPFLEDMNGMFLLAFRQIAYLMQDGIPEWNTDTSYFTGSIVRKVGTTELYGSVIDNNLANALPSQTTNGFWAYLNPATVAPGVISDFGGASAPLGWLPCDGSVVAQATYPGLFAAIGATWNTGGEGGGNFRLPDLRGRTTMGVGQGSGLSNRTLATLVGEETHLLITGEIPIHSHSITDPGHAHDVGPRPYGNFGGGSGPGGGVDAPAASPPFAHNVTALSASTGISATNNTGGGGVHNNMQPTAVVTKIIKT